MGNPFVHIELNTNDAAKAKNCIVHLLSKLRVI